MYRNKIIEDKQCTISFHIDDNKISHTEQNVVAGVIELLESEFSKMIITHSKIHDFFRMKLEFLDNGRVSVDAKSYLATATKEYKEEFGEIGTSITLPVRNNLFAYNNTSSRIPKQKRAKFCNSLEL